jgi:hypothetical protein
MAPEAPPTVIDLRPLTTSELIDRGFTLYRQNFAGLLLLALLSQAGPLLAQVLTTVLHLVPTQDEMLVAPQRIVVKLVFFLGILVLTQLIVFGFSVVITFYVADVYLGRVPSVTSSFRRFGGKLFGTAWTCVLNRVFYLLTAIFPILAEIVLVLGYQFLPPRSFGSFVVFIGASAVLVVASLVPVLVVAMRLMLTVPVLALEGWSGWKACRRSSALVRFDPGLGFFYWGETRLSLLLLPLFVIQVLTSTLTSLPMILAQAHEMIRHGTATAVTNPSDVVVVGSQIMTYLAGALILPLYTIAVTLFYYDVRIRREGFDLEFLAGRLETAS